MIPDIKSLLISEEDFRRTMEEQIEPWIDKEFTSGKFTS